jgi:hypothetical protein
MHFAHSQTQLSFCGAVNDGNCTFNNTKFITSLDSLTGTVYMLVKNANGLSASKLTYKVFAVDNAGTEKLLDSLEQDIEANWIYAWKTATVPTPGKYKVRVYDETGKMVSTKGFDFYDVW